MDKNTFDFCGVRPPPISSFSIKDSANCTNCPPACKPALKGNIQPDIFPSSTGKTFISFTESIFNISCERPSDGVPMGERKYSFQSGLFIHIVSLGNV